MADSQRWTSSVLPILLLVAGIVFWLQRPQTVARRWLSSGMVGAAVGGLYFNYRRKSRSQHAATKMLDINKGLYSGLHEFAFADEASFKGLDRAFYDQMRAEFEARGFRYLADIEDLTAKRILPWMHGVVRVMLSHDGTITGDMYHVQVTGWWKILQVIGVVSRRLKTVEAGSELSDGTFVWTSDSLGVDRSAEMPGIIKNRLVPKTPLKEILRVHRESVGRLISQDPSRLVVPIRNFREMIAAQHRLQAKKNAHKRGVGFIDRNELESVQGRPLNATEEQILADIDSLKAGDASDGRDSAGDPRS